MASSIIAADSSSKKQLTIHKIREIPLEMIDIDINYDVIREIGSGDYGKVILASHKRSHCEVTIKNHHKSMATIST